MSTINIVQKTDCSSITQLPNVNLQGFFRNHGDDTLFLVSQYQENESNFGGKLSGFYSKKISFGELVDLLDTSLEVGETKFNVNSLSSRTQDWENFKQLLSTHVMIAQEGEPYIISSLNIVSSLITGVNAYRLSSGMKYEFDHAKFDCLDLSLSYNENLNGIVLKNRDGSIDQFVSRDNIISDVLQDYSDNMITKVERDEEGNKLSIYFNVSGKDFPIEIEASSIGRLYDFTWENSGLSAIDPNGVSVGLDLDYVKRNLSDEMTTIEIRRWGSKREN